MLGRLGGTLCVLILAGLLTPSLATLDPKRTLLIDTSSPSSGANNFLFRSNEPTNANNTFAYNDLLAYFADRAAAGGHTWPAEVYIVDISLLNPTEVKDEEIEKKYFEANPTHGEYINWPIVGNIVKPNDLPGDVVKALAETMGDWDVDKLPHRIPQLRQWLDTKYDVPRAFLVHCEAGTHFPTTLHYTTLHCTTYHPPPLID